MNTEEVRRIIRLTFQKENINGYWKERVHLDVLQHQIYLIILIVLK